MARPIKNNLDYFSHDKDMRNDLKIRNLRRKFSHKGYSIYVMMLEHLSDCEYLQYEWNELSIELLVPDFDVDVEELKEIIDHCIKLKLFDVEEGYIFSNKFYERNQEVLNKRNSFNLGNSPINQLKKNKPSDNGVNSTLTIVNSDLIHKVKYSKEKESKEEDSIVEYSKVQNKISNEFKELTKIQRDELSPEELEQYWIQLDIRNKTQLNNN